MPHRAASPAVSENDIDISGALFGAEDTATAESNKVPTNFENLNLEIDENDDEDASFIASLQAASNRKASTLKGRTVKKGGAFQSMGLNANLLKAITRKGFSVPTPIQRKTIPLVLDRLDVVGMARTGSGKTAAFVIPILEMLKGHSTNGARALMISPSRELALQTLKVVKELGKGTDLKSALLVGGDTMEEQFSLMSGNPDIVVATPGRFQHLSVEMRLDLSSMKYVVFDEADRLFEMGFAAQLGEILHSLPQDRQTLLFSATLPKTLVEFTKAGLRDPRLVRLDSDSKISPDLQSAFFTMKTADKDGALLHLLMDVIRIPLGDTEATKKSKAAVAAPQSSKKRKRSENSDQDPKSAPSPHSTLIFTSTKYHVEYISTLLRATGFAVSHAYGALDQTARKMQVHDFRSGVTNILVVTDVAARGIDIPILANVINYDFPPQPKIFVHRAGRTARAGQKGWSYSLIGQSDAPYLLDLQLFLGKRLVLGRSTNVTSINYTDDVVIGGMSRERLAEKSEWVGKLLSEDTDISALRDVARKGERLYLKTRGAASSESARRAKKVTTSREWNGLHRLFENKKGDEDVDAELAAEQMLARVSGFRPPETVFEIGKRGVAGELGEVVKKQRRTIDAKRRRKEALALFSQRDDEPGSERKMAAKSVAALLPSPPTSPLRSSRSPSPSPSSASDLDVEITEQTPRIRNMNPSSSSIFNYQDPNHYLPYLPTQSNAATDRAYAVNPGSTSSSHFLTQAASLTMDLNPDSTVTDSGGTHIQAKRWDKKQKKYVSRANDFDGSRSTAGKLADGAGTKSKWIKDESGRRIPASMRTGRYDAWRKANRLPASGKMSSTDSVPCSRPDGENIGEKKYKYNATRMPKTPDKFRDDYHKQKKAIVAAREREQGPQLGGKDRQGSGKGELRSVDAVRKMRAEKERRREKTGRHAGKMGGRGGGSRGRGRGRGGRGGVKAGGRRMK